MKYGEAGVRRQAILERLRESGFLSIGDLARGLSVSEMTVRRDLRLLSGEAPINLVHGGASVSPADRVPDFAGRSAVEREAKGAIAVRAMGLVADEDAIGLDAGTTALEIARALPTAFRGCVVTPSLPVLNHLLPRAELRVIALAGELFRPSLAFAGPMTVAAARDLRLATFFLGAAAVDARGVYVAADGERASKLALMEAATRVVLVADATKFSASAPVRLCGLDRVDVIVTDRRTPPEVVRELNAVTSILVAD